MGRRIWVSAIGHGETIIFTAYGVNADCLQIHCQGQRPADVLQIIGGLLHVDQHTINTGIIHVVVRHRGCERRNAYR